MTLFAADHQHAVERAAAADLDGVPNRNRVAGLSQNAMVEAVAPLARPFQELDCAIHRNALLIAGDEERDGAHGGAGTGSKMIERCRDGAGNRPFHIDCPATVKNVPGDLAGEWQMRPSGCIARWHHVYFTP